MAGRNLRGVSLSVFVPGSQRKAAAPVCEQVFGVVLTNKLTGIRATAVWQPKIALMDSLSGAAFISYFWRNPLKLPHLTLAGAVLTALLIVVSAVGTRAGVWHFATGFQIMAIGMSLGLFVLMMGIAALISARQREYKPLSLLAMILLVAALALPLSGLYQATKVPEIHDISTDLDNPPAFVAAAALRQADENSAIHAGAGLAETQRNAYPDITPAYLPLAAAAAFDKALAAAQAMGWEIIAAEPTEGRIEAVATSRWFAFKDDVVIRVQQDGPVSRIDMRSMSRIGSSDLGVNAQRIRDYKTQLATR